MFKNVGSEAHDSHVLLFRRSSVDALRAIVRSSCHEVEVVRVKWIGCLGERRTWRSERTDDDDDDEEEEEELEDT